jgi:hypothetical protein
MTKLIKLVTLLGMTMITTACNGHPALTEKEIKKISSFIMYEKAQYIDKGSLKLSNCKNGESLPDLIDHMNGEHIFKLRKVICDAKYLTLKEKQHSVITVKFGYEKGGYPAAGGHIDIKDVK